MKKKTIALFLALALVVGCAIGGTVAWLTATTDPVVNTFTVGDINIELKETLKPDGTTLGENDSWSAPIVPGNTYRKNPTVTVKANSEDCYLFVKIDETNMPNTASKTYVQYTLNTSGWTQGTGTGEGGDGVPTDVWYRTVVSSLADTTYELLTKLGDKNTTYEVSIPATLTKDDIKNLYNQDGSAKSFNISFTAYAVQQDNLTAAEAWAELNPTT